MEYIHHMKVNHQEITNLVNGIVFQGEHYNTGTQDTEIDKLKQQVNIFKNDVAIPFMPWISDVPQNSEVDDYNKAIPELASKVEKMKAVRNTHSWNSQ